MRLNWREHEVGGDHPKIRVWTDDMGRYGQFDVVEYKDFEKLKYLSSVYTFITLVEAPND